MIKSIRHINTDWHLIPSIIEEISLTYSNFSHFELIEDSKCKGFYDMILYFFDKESISSESKDTMIKCTIIKGVWHNEIDKILANQFLNFNGYTKSYTFKSYEKKDAYDLIMVHNISKADFNKKPATIRLNHCGFTGKGLNTSVSGYSFYEYGGESINCYSAKGRKLFDWSLEITCAKNFIIVSQKYNHNEDIVWFTISCGDAESANIIVKTYKDEVDSIYNHNKVIDMEYTVSVDNLDTILAQLLEHIEDKHNLILAKDAKDKFIETTLDYIKQYTFRK